jgi:hypothetical protein
MNFLKQLAGMFTAKPSGAGQGGDPGLYYYIRCNRCGEVIRVRINPMNDLSIADDGTRFTHKTIVGKRCYNRIEGEFTYNNGRKLINAEISGGDMVTEDEYNAQQTPTTT